MNKQTLILILVFLVLLIPTSVVLKSYALDKFERLKSEGGVAYCVAHLETPDINLNKPDVKPSPTPVQTTCNECKGTGKIKSGDGLFVSDCPCGKNCKCQAMKTEPEKVKVDKKIILITAPSWCMSCKQIDEYTIPAIKKTGWKVEKNGHVEIYDYDNHPELVEKYEIDLVPTWILLENDKEVSRYSGFLNGFGVGSFWHKKVLQNSDTTLIFQKSKK
jgi:thiol-disulfide isomerase/thioredoxin